MKRSIPATISAALAATLLLGCAAPGPDPQADTPNVRQLVKIEFPDDPISTTYFFYNEAGDISRIFNATDTAVYTYGTDSIRIDWVDGQGKSFAFHRIAVSPDGKVRTNAVLDHTGTVFSNSEYTYDETGRLLLFMRKNMRTNDLFSMTHHYAGDNLDYVDMSRNDEHLDRFGYVYDTAYLNHFQIDLENLTNDHFTNSRIGQVSKHLLKEAWRINAQGDTTAHRKFSYELDGDGYVTKRIDTDVQYGITTVRQFSYQ